MQAQAIMNKDKIDAEIAGLLQRDAALASLQKEEREDVQSFRAQTEIPAEQQLAAMNILPQILQSLSNPGIASILGLMGGGGIAPILQPALNEAGVMGQQGAPIFNALPTQSYLQQIGPSAAQGLQALTGFAGLDPSTLGRIISSVTPGAASMLPTRRAGAARTTGVR